MKDAYLACNNYNIKLILEILKKILKVEECGRIKRFNHINLLICLKYIF